jgi:hypothetical protein
LDLDNFDKATYLRGEYFQWLYIMVEVLDSLPRNT